jgi:hypothetical protein
MMAVVMMVTTVKKLTAEPDVPMPNAKQSYVPPI